MTLIETLAGLALLAFILVALLTAQARHYGQWNLAKSKLEAVAAADELLAIWWSEPNRIPEHAQGSIPAHPSLKWRTQKIGNSTLEFCGGHVVRLEIFNSTSTEKSLSSVEIVLPNDTSPTTSPTPQ